MAVDDEISARSLEFVLRQPIADHILHSIILCPNLRVPSPFPPRLHKTFLLRRLVSHLSSSFSTQTLDTFELIDQLDRDHNLAPNPSPALQQAYAAVAVDLTARWLTDEADNLGDFLDAVDSIWNRRLGDLERSEARGLASPRLIEERTAIGAAAVDVVARKEFMGRHSRTEAAAAVASYVKETAAEMGPAFLKMAAVDAAERPDEEGERRGQVEELGEKITSGHGDEERTILSGNDTLTGDGCSIARPNDICEPSIIQEKTPLKPIDQEVHHMVGEPMNPTAVQRKVTLEKYPKPSEELQMPRSKRKKVTTSPMHHKGSGGRRQKKWWTEEEENTLREAIEKHGEGNWTLIKNSYPNTFEERTPVDLKDKWRNMTKQQ